MKKDHWKQALISVFIGACVAFFATLFDGIAEFLKQHSTQIAGGVTATLTYLAKSIKWS